MTEEQRILTVFRTERDTYIIEKPSINPHESIYVDGAHFTCGVEAAIVPKSAYIKKSFCEDSHWENENGDILSLEDRDSTIADLQEKGEYCDDDYEYNFKNIEDEVAYKRFVREWTLKREQKSESFELDIQIKDLPFSKNKYIEPKYKVSGDITDPTCTYTPNYFEMFEENLPEDYVLIIDDTVFGPDKSDSKMFTVPNHSTATLEFLKFNGNYCKFPLQVKLLCASNKRIWPHTDSYSECLKKYEHDLRAIKDCIAYCLRSRDALTEDERKYIRDEVSIAFRAICEVDPKRKTYDSWISARNRLSKLIEKL